MDSKKITQLAKSKDGAGLRKELKDCWRGIFPYGTMPRDVEKIVQDLTHLYTYEVNEKTWANLRENIENAKVTLKPILKKFNLE